MYPPDGVIVSVNYIWLWFFGTFELSCSPRKNVDFLRLQSKQPTRSFPALMEIPIIEAFKTSDGWSPFS